MERFDFNFDPLCVGDTSTLGLAEELLEQQVDDAGVGRVVEILSLLHKGALLELRFSADEHFVNGVVGLSCLNCKYALLAPAGASSPELFEQLYRLFVRPEILLSQK